MQAVLTHRRFWLAGSAFRLDFFLAGASRKLPVPRLLSPLVTRVPLWRAVTWAPCPSISVGNSGADVSDQGSTAAPEYINLSGLYVKTRSRVRKERASLVRMEKRANWPTQCCKSGPRLGWIDNGMCGSSGVDSKKRRGNRKFGPGRGKQIRS